MAVLLWISSLALGAVLLWPSALDPVHPLQPGWIVAGLIVGALGPVAAAASAFRKRSAGAVLGYAAVLTALMICTPLVAPALLYGVGWHRTVPILGLLALAAVSLLWLLEIRRVLTGALLAAVAVLVAVTALIPTRLPSDLEAQSAIIVRRACRLAPGYGPMSLAVAGMRKLRPLPARQYRPRLQAAATGLADITAEPEAGRWRDDARLVRAFLLRKIAASLPAGPEREPYLREAATDSSAFAANETAQLERWTRRGVLVHEALERTAGLNTPEPVRMRVAAAADALHTWVQSGGVDDPRAEHESYQLIHSLFEELDLDRTHPVYLSTVILEAGRYKEQKQWDQLVRFYDDVLQIEWPDSIRKRMEAEQEAARKEAREL